MNTKHTPEPCRMNPQSRDIVRGMLATGTLPDACQICGEELGNTNRYSPFADVCRACADECCAEGE